MFESLSEKLESVFKKLRSKGILKEEDIDIALKEVRLAPHNIVFEVTESMAVERYSHVMHLVSQVEAELAPGKTGLDAVRATFPAGLL